MLLIAFKNSDGSMVSKIVKLWQNYPYVHCELVFVTKAYQCFSANTRFQAQWSNKVAIHEFGTVVQKPENWKFYQLPVSDQEIQTAWTYAQTLVGKEYNMKGMFGLIFGNSTTNANERHCSEACYDVLKNSTQLQLPVYAQFQVTPEILHKIVLERQYPEVTIK